jgi:REP element-mobilizing transposase RayT
LEKRRMASTYLSLHYHLVFATKNREAVIAPEWRSCMSVDFRRASAAWPIMSTFWSA